MRASAPRPGLRTGLARRGELELCAAAYAFVSVERRRMGGRGFTLIEVLVALVVLGAIASAAIALIGQNTRYLTAAEDRQLASIVADNAMVEALSLALVDVGAGETEAEFAGERWTVTRTVAESGAAGLLRVDVTVRRAGAAQTLARATTIRPALPQTPQNTRIR